MLDANELSAWLGNSTYKHRRKTVAIIDALKNLSGPLVFIDSDTYFKRSPKFLFDRIGPGMTCFHTREARLFEAGDPENEKLVTGIRTHKVFDASGQIIPFTERDEMWNTGVLGVTAENMTALQAALPIMEQLWITTRSAPVEQFAVGFTLAGTRRMQCRDIVYHYWNGDIRRRFESKLLAIISQLQTLAMSDRPAAAYRYRPKWPLHSIVRSRVREFTRWLGLPTRGVIKSV